MMLFMCSVGSEYIVIRLLNDDLLIRQTFMAKLVPEQTATLAICERALNPCKHMGIMHCLLSINIPI